MVGIYLIFNSDDMFEFLAVNQKKNILYSLNQ